MLLLQELLLLSQLGIRACCSTYEGARFMCMFHCVCACLHVSAAAVSSSFKPCSIVTQMVAASISHQVCAKSRCHNDNNNNNNNNDDNNLQVCQPMLGTY